MFLSKLVVNVGNRADRLRPGRRWIEKPYRVHQRLCMAFPKDGRSNDPHFLQPFDPANFFDYPGTAPEWDATRPKAVHVQRAHENGFLFRIDLDSNGQPFILVQSGREPDWDYAFHNAGHLIKSHIKQSYDPSFQKEQVLRFRLRANPTKRQSLPPEQWRELPREHRKKGRRIPLFSDAEQMEWLNRHALKCGFHINHVNLVHEGRVVAAKAEDLLSFLAVLFDGILEVTDPNLFRNTLAAGIGPAKAFGFGLLSVAPPH